MGFGPRDVLCLWCSNYVEWWLLAMAAWSCGGCVMPVNCEIDLDCLEQRLVQAQAKVLVCDAFNMADGVEILEGTDILRHVVVVGAEHEEQQCRATGCVPVSDLLLDDGKTPPRKDGGCVSLDNDVAFLPFSSGMASREATGIMHTHKSILAWFFQPENTANHYLDQMMGDELGLGNWFFHLSGFYPVALAAIYGVSVYTQSDYSDEGLMNMLSEHRLPSAALYPWQIRLLSQSPDVDKFDLNNLRSVATSGSVLSSTIRLELMERFPNIKFVREAYGLNESGIVALTYPREKKISLQGGKQLDLPDDHIMPLGIPTVFAQIKIITRQGDNEPVSGPDEQGEICIRGPQLFSGYLNLSQRENSKLFDQDGFFRTGDLGYYDAQGNLYFVERIENLIHFWMYEVAPTIIESRLLGSNNIVDAAVVGIPNKENGEVPRAFVVLKPGFEETEENLTSLMESRLQDHERIRGGLYFIRSIPRDENWRVMTHVLKEYTPMSTEEHNRMVDEEESKRGGSSGSLGANLAKPGGVGKSPKLVRKQLVQELERMPNGAFRIEAKEQESNSRSRRNNSFKALDKEDESEVKQGLDLQNPGEASKETFGLRHRSRRGSQDVMDTDALSRHLGLASALPVLHEPSAKFVDKERKDEYFSYWRQVHVHAPSVASALKSHPSVEDVLVQGFAVSGLGLIPRAYVELRSGYDASPEELLCHAHARLNDNDRLRGGIVIVDRLARDPESGRIVVNLDQHTAHHVDHEFINLQPRVKLL